MLPHFWLILSITSYHYYDNTYYYYTDNYYYYYDNYLLLHILKTTYFYHNYLLLQQLLNYFNSYLLLQQLLLATTISYFLLLLLLTTTNYLFFKTFESAFYYFRCSGCSCLSQCTRCSQTAVHVSSALSTGNLPATTPNRSCDDWLGDMTENDWNVQLWVCGRAQIQLRCSPHGHTKIAPHSDVTYWSYFATKLF